jgi:hypothetical protein
MIEIPTLCRIALARESVNKHLLYKGIYKPLATSSAIVHKQPVAEILFTGRYGFLFTRKHNTLIKTYAYNN